MSTIRKFDIFLSNEISTNENEKNGNENKWINPCKTVTRMRLNVDVVYHAHPYMNVPFFPRNRFHDAERERDTQTPESNAMPLRIRDGFSCSTTHYNTHTFYAYNKIIWSFILYENRLAIHVFHLLTHSFEMVLHGCAISSLVLSPFNVYALFGSF